MLLKEHLSEVIHRLHIVEICNFCGVFRLTIHKVGALWLGLQ
jgi:hypothetical protein